MVSRPRPDTLQVNVVSYHVAGHPTTRSVACGQERDDATVYQLVVSEGQKRDLTAFKPRFCTPSLASQAENLGTYADSYGLRVHHCVVLPHFRQLDLLRKHSDLTCALLMSSFEGSTWQKVRFGKDALLPERSLALRGAAGLTVADLEERRGRSWFIRLLRASLADNMSCTCGRGIPDLICAARAQCLSGSLTSVGTCQRCQLAWGVLLTSVVLGWVL